MVQITLMNGASVEVSQEEVNKFISQILVPNPDWRYSGLLTQEEVMRYLKGEGPRDELKKVARYILIYQENLAFTAYLFDKSEGHPDQGKEFNMPAIKALREIYRKVTDNQLSVAIISSAVKLMESTCMKIGADPL